MADEASEPIRPALTRSLDEVEFRRWYWTLAELQVAAREFGLSASGRKADVTERIAAALGGRTQPTTARSTTTDHLAGPLTRDTGPT